MHDKRQPLSSHCVGVDEVDESHQTRQIRLDVLFVFTFHTVFGIIPLLPHLLQPIVSRAQHHPRRIGKQRPAQMRCGWLVISTSGNLREYFTSYGEGICLQCLMMPYIPGRNLPTTGVRSCRVCIGMRGNLKSCEPFCRLGRSYKVISMVLWAPDPRIIRRKGF